MTLGIGILIFIVVLDIGVAIWLWWSDPGRRTEELERRLRKAGGM